MSAANPTWTDDIQQMFTATDIQHMQGQGIDLSSYDVVSQAAPQILQEVTPPDPTKEPSSANQPNMPPQNSPETPWWTLEMIKTFTTWMNKGYPQ
ncbi:MAG: hypothetical protein JOY71_01215 [Acetobacteraceae bacterium]|nr:hypothetical protein [Acetobacteraceae bacterium]MBV8578216.1 hypothetical protein [Acetobacteraceae bacterium]